MRRVSLYLVIMMLCCSLASSGQNSPLDTLFTINDSAFSSEQFVKLYQSKKIAGSYKQTLPIKEALDLHIDFRLKVKEARNLKIDTLPEVKNEIRTYMDIALYSFMYPVNISEDKITEAFNRIQYFLKARHILIEANKQSSPKDTIEAYKKAMLIYRELEKGARFTKMAKNYSDDLSLRSNFGELGYFTAFDMDYEFETAAYNLNIGDFSKPVRTQFGYHIIQILEKTPNPGKVKVRHLFLEYGKNNNRKHRQKLRHKADSLYRLLQNGANFADLAKQYQNDNKLLVTDGILPWFGLFETHPEIEKAAFQLQGINEFSNPIETEFGIHIIQLLAKQDYSSFEGCRKILKNLISRDNRSKPSVGELIAKIKKEYQFSENRSLLANFYSILDYAYADLWVPLFIIGGEKYTLEDFANYLSRQPSKDIYENFIEYINRQYENFLKISILAFYKKQLINTNTELQTVIKDYEDRVLAFFITKQKLWDENNFDNEAIYKYFRENADNYGENANFEDAKNKVSSDYREFIEASWLKQLRIKYRVKIINPTLSKISGN